MSGLQCRRPLPHSLPTLLLPQASPLLRCRASTTVVLSLSPFLGRGSSFTPGSGPPPQLESVVTPLQPATASPSRLTRTWPLPLLCIQAMAPPLHLELALSCVTSSVSTDQGRPCRVPSASAAQARDEELHLCRGTSIAAPSMQGHRS
jgi:hypothetical protein